VHDKAMILKKNRRISPFFSADTENPYGIGARGDVVAVVLSPSPLSFFYISPA